MDTVVTRISIWLIVFLFFGYIGGHILIASMKKELEKKIKDKPGNEEDKKQYKIYNHLFKWFPAYYVLFILFVFYIQ